MNVGDEVDFEAGGDLVGNGTSGDDQTIGTDVAVDFVAEGMFDVGPRSWLGPRAVVGLTVLVPGGDLKDALEEFEGFCNGLDASGCDNLTGPKPGVNFGIGGGFMTALSDSARVRVDLMYQWYLINLLSIEPGGADATIEENLTGSRLFLAAGIEL